MVAAVGRLDVDEVGALAAQLRASRSRPASAIRRRRARHSSSGDTCPKLIGLASRKRCLCTGPPIAALIAAGLFGRANATFSVALTARAWEPPTSALGVNAGEPASASAATSSFSVTIWPGAAAPTATGVSGRGRMLLVVSLEGFRLSMPRLSMPDVDEQPAITTAHNATLARRTTERMMPRTQYKNRRQAGRAQTQKRISNGELPTKFESNP